MRIKSLVLFSLCSLTVVGCGGGESGKNTTNPTPPVSATNHPPIAIISTASATAYVDEWVTLSGAQSSDPDGDKISYQWTIVAPSQQSQTSPVMTDPDVTFLPVETGNYQISLTVSDSKIRSAAQHYQLTVTEKAPNSAVVNISAPSTATTVNVPLVLTANATGFDSSKPLVITWKIANQPRGANARFSKDNSATTQFSADSEGLYQLQVLINDGVQYAQQNITIDVKAAVLPLQAVVTGPSQATQHTTVSLSGADSQLQNNTTFTWRFVSKPATSQASLVGVHDRTASFIADQAGDYQIQLELVSGQQRSVAVHALTVSQVVNNRPPIARITTQANNITINTDVALSAANSEDPDHDPLTYLWQVLQAPDGAQPKLASSKTQSTHFQADMVGQYVVQVTVSDGQASTSATITLQVYPKNSAPIVAINYDEKTYRAGDSVALFGVALDKEQQPLSYAWRVVKRPAVSHTDIATPLELNTLFTTDTAGEYQIEFTATNPNKLANSAYVILKIGANLPPAIVDVKYAQQINVMTPSELRVEAIDPEGAPLTYSWTVDSKPAGATVTISNPDQATTSLQVSEPGLYTITISVNDGVQDVLIPFVFAIIAK